MPSRRPPRVEPRSKKKPELARGRTARELEREVARLEATLEAERRCHGRQLENVRRLADRRLTAIMKEIAALRHHEARAEELGRRLAECEARLQGGRNPGRTTAATLPLTRDPDGEEPLGGGWPDDRGDK